MFTAPFLEMFITTVLTAVASTAMGLCVSSMFKNADRAMTLAPILLMPQILFSGLIFNLEGATEYISWFAICRWSMEGYGTTADLNALKPNGYDDTFEYTFDDTVPFDDYIDYEGEQEYETDYEFETEVKMEVGGMTQRQKVEDTIHIEDTFEIKEKIHVKQDVQVKKDLEIKGEDILKNDPEDFYEHNIAHMIKAWAVLFLFTIVFLILSRITLSSIKKSE